MTAPTPAASALIVHGDRILLVRSTRTRERWAFPGGRREKGETPGQNAVREVMEEVGLPIKLTRELGKYVIAASGFEITCFAATAATMELKLDANEILEARWCTIDEALQLDLISTVREALVEFRGTSAA
jgi:8-oxo-dGTP pyrophosphatase MutT (NUDIX family)